MLRGNVMVGDIMNYLLLQSIEKLHTKIYLSKLCSCQLVQLADAIESVDSDKKELILGFIYLKSLIQGIINSHDYQNYWAYLRTIGDRKIAMVYHGSAEFQFRMLLKIPEYSPAFNQLTMNQKVSLLSNRRGKEDLIQPAEYQSLKIKLGDSKDFFMTLMNTGMRIHELYSLQFSNIFKGDEDLDDTLKMP